MTTLVAPPLPDGAAADGGPAPPADRDRPARVTPHAVEGRLRLLARWLRYAAVSLRRGHVAGVRDAGWASLRLFTSWAGDTVWPSDRVACNLCGWRGRAFYPNIGPGWFEPHVVCPGCRCQDRHRALFTLLPRLTRFLERGARVIEVAPMRRFEALCVAQPGMDYTSFDLRRKAMHPGDITAMRYADTSADVFLCLHVLEHIPDEAAAMNEIRRVLKPGGVAVFQVPIDWDTERTRQYDAPDPSDNDHVRQYGRDFGDLIAAYGFTTKAVSVTEVLPAEAIERHGLSTEPLFFATKPPTSTGPGRE